MYLKAHRLGIGLAISLVGPLVISLLAKDPPAFEVASIKLAPPSGAPGGSISGGRFTSSALPLISLIRFAYNVRVYQVSGAPPWLSEELYDIAAKAEGEGSFTVDQVRLMAQKLLADRLQLRLHREMKELPVYLLVVGKNGLKLKQSGAGVSNRTMAQFSATLSSQLDRPVLDRTGLSGSYDFKLEFAPENQALNPNAPSSDTIGFPSIFTAIQEQLGLRLEPTKGPVEILVIDHVERPSGN